jgi:hypothetical protein
MLPTELLVKCTVKGALPLVLLAVKMGAKDCVAGSQPTHAACPLETASRKCRVGSGRPYPRAGNCTKKERNMAADSPSKTATRLLVPNRFIIGFL